MEKFRYLENVASLKLDLETCIGCEMCVTVCPHRIFRMHAGKAEISDLDACMECGACARNCPVEAISVEAGVGCASAVINSALGRKDNSCCCVIESKEENPA